MKDFLFGGARINSVLGDFGLLVLRAFAGTSIALAHGLGKLPPSEGFMKGVASLGLPAESAWLSGFAEFFGGLALAAGLLTRPAAFLIICNLSVAAFMQHKSDPYQRAELAYIFLAVAVMFLCMGGGRFSIDRVFKR